MALARWGSQVPPAPAIEQTRLGTARLEPVSLPPVSLPACCQQCHQKSLPKMQSWLRHPPALLALVTHKRIQTVTNSLGQVSQLQLPLEPPGSPGLSTLNFPWFGSGKGFQYLLAFAHAVCPWNALIPSSSHGSKSSSKTGFRCFYLKKGEVHCPLHCVPTAPCPGPGKSTIWLFDNLSVCVCLATSPACLMAGIFHDYSSVSGTLLMLKKVC